MMGRWRFLMYGRVQGVGLRYRTYMLASELPVTGGIANLDDGSVELLAQGEKADVDKLISQIKRLRFVRVNRIESEEIDVIPEKGFRMLN